MVVLVFFPILIPTLAPILVLVIYRTRNRLGDDCIGPHRAFFLIKVGVL
jgi:hypothetical protein